LTRAGAYETFHYVKRAEFEHSVLTLWMTSQVPLTRANIQFYTGVERRQLERWLDEMVKSGALEFDSDDAGEILYTVPGAERSASGPSDIASVRKDADAKKKLEELRRSLPQKSLVKRAEAPKVALSEPTKHDRSLIAAGALSFFFGPLGWLYAAPIKEAAPAIAVFLVAMAVLPHLILYPLLGLFMPLSAVAGVAYAYLYNKKGDRTSIVDMTKKQLPPRRD
jgi:hypothetical protein